MSRRVSACGSQREPHVRPDGTQVSERVACLVRHGPDAMVIDSTRGPTRIYYAQSGGSASEFCCVVSAGRYAQFTKFDRVQSNVNETRVIGNLVVFGRAPRPLTRPRAREVRDRTETRVVRSVNKTVPGAVGPSYRLRTGRSPDRGPGRTRDSERDVRSRRTRDGGRRILISLTKCLLATSHSRPSPNGSITRWSDELPSFTMVSQPNGSLAPSSCTCARSCPSGITTISMTCTRVSGSS